MIAFVFGVIRVATSSGSRFSVLRVDVGEDRRGAALRDRLGSRVERERRADHLVAGADAERVEDEDERVRAVRDADRLRDAEIGGRLVLERRDVRPEDELGRTRPPRRSAAFSSGIRGAYCALTSTSGIIGTAVSLRGPVGAAPATPRGRTTATTTAIVDKAEILVDALVAAFRHAQPIPAKREAPDRRADERQQGVPAERRANDAAGIATNERTTGVTRPSEDGEVAAALEPAPRRASSFSGVRWNQPAVPLEQRPAAAEADRPADQRADEVAERPGERRRRCTPRSASRSGGRTASRAADERAARQRARVDHHELARRPGSTASIEHQHEDGVDAVVADERRDRGVTEPRTTDRGYFRRTWKVAPSVTEPSSFVAVASAT